MHKERALVQQLIEEVRAIIDRALTPDDFYRASAESIHQFFGYEFVAFCMIEGDMLVARHVSGLDSPLRSMPISQGVIGRVAHTGIPVFLPDIRSDPDAIIVDPTILSEIAFPLTDQAQLVRAPRQSFSPR